MRLIVLNLTMGGPSSLSDVQPFLYKLFSDPAILRIPQPFRYLLANVISRLRASHARDIYAQIGGKSPLFEETQAQSRALETSLHEKGYIVRVISAMRYVKPFARDVMTEIRAFSPDRILLLPLYPQYSTTTTKSSFDDFYASIPMRSRIANISKSNGHNPSILPSPEAICCYYEHPLFAKAYDDLLRPLYEKALREGAPRIIFSAHGLPQKIVNAGDPYPWQIDRSMQAILNVFRDREGYVPDHRIAYQSKVGPLKWLEPSLETVLREAARDQVPVIVLPLSFVSEHSETLFELDIEYAEKAQSMGIQFYQRVPTVRCHPLFIEALTTLVDDHLRGKNVFKTCGSNYGRSCSNRPSSCREIL